MHRVAPPSFTSWIAYFVITRYNFSMKLAIRPNAAQAGLSHDTLDELKRSIALAVVRSFTARQIRAQILANLHRWKSQGVWVSAYDEWRELAQQEDDGPLFAAMLGHDENAVRLRQSMPFVGLLSQAEVGRLARDFGSVDSVNS
jgi:hypothetical protein